MVLSRAQVARRDRFAGDVAVQGPGRPDPPPVELSVLVDDAEHRGELVAGSARISADGRVGGEWKVRARSAEEAAASAAQLLRHALVQAKLDEDEAIVGYLPVEPSSGDD
jgi:hypothetical protein